MSTHGPLFFSIVFWVCFQDNYFIIMVMSPKNLRLSPISKEYFKLPNRRTYKVCNRYEIAKITLEDFGLKTNDDQGKGLASRGLESDMMVSNPEYEKSVDVDKPFCCTHCGSEDYIKYGKKNSKQVFKCKVCNRKFVDNLFFERRKANPKIICLTLDLYFKGVSLRKISDHLKQFHDIDVCFTTIFRWIDRYIRIMDEYVRQFKPNLSEIWNVDEMMIKIDGDWFYLWNVIDDASRFHLASVISRERKSWDAQRVFIQAKKTSYGQRPQVIITDGLKSYGKAIDEEFHTIRKKTIHIGNVGIRGKKHNGDCFDNNIVERLQGTIRERNKTQRGLKDEFTSFIRGHQLYYNFIKPHESLFGNTPSEVAGIDLNLGKKKWEKLLIKSMKYHNEEEK